jgi:hypothetical protein
MVKMKLSAIRRSNKPQVAGVASHVERLFRTRYARPMKWIQWTVLLLLGCGDGFLVQPTRVIFEPTRTDFWALPLPSDLRRQADGTFNLERYPPPRSSLMSLWLKAADARLTDGWGVTSGIFFTLSGAPDPATLPSATGSMEANAAVYLVDVDPFSPEYGNPLPVNVSFTAEESQNSPANLLEIIPAWGFVRRPSTTYAVVITDAVKDASGKSLGRSEAFHNAFEQRSEADAKAAASFEPLRAWLQRTQRDRSRVVGATVFKTMDPSAPLMKVAQWIERQPPPAVAGPWKLEAEFQSFQWVFNRFTVPQIQAGERPGEGPIEWDSDGQPKQVGTQQVRLALSIPKTAMPAGGFPLMIYFHGSGGQYREVIDRGPLPQTAARKKQEPAPTPGSGPAEYLARRGIAALGFDFPLHGDRKDPPDTNGLQLYNLFGNIEVTLDNMQVGAMEALYLSRLATRLEVPAALSPNFNAAGAADGMIRFDPTRLTAMGHSMGSTFAVPIATVDPRIRGFVFSGSGGSLVEIANSALEPVELKPFIELLLGFPEGTTLRRSHPLLHVFQNLWDYADPSAKARHVAREPHEGMKPRPFFLTAGIRDGYFHPNSQTAIAVSLGATQAGEEVDPTTVEGLKLSGRSLAPYPLENNLNAVTAALVQYAAPFELGHYVAFDRPDTRQQFTCFILGVGTAAGPKVAAASGSDTVCP